MSRVDPRHAGDFDALLLPLIERHVKLERAGRLWQGCCPFHAEKTPSFTVYPDHYHCFGCGAHGDAIAFIRRIEGLSFPEALARLNTKAGLDTPRSAPKRVGLARQQAPRTKPEPQGEANYAVQLFTESQPLPGTLAEHYARITRRIGDLPLPAEIRFHPAVWSKQTKTNHPALLAPCFDGDKLVRIQVVLLDPATGDKASVKKPKRIYGAGVAHIPARFAAREPSSWVVLTEGPEDAITVSAVMGWQTEASLGSGSLDKPCYSAGTNLIILGDNDGGSGPAEAHAAAAAHHDRGVNVRVAFPPDGIKDANDLLRQRGPAAVRECITQALRPPAQRFSDDSVPLEGTFGEYAAKQTWGCPRPAAGWPDALRWLEADNAIVAVVTRADGAVTATQRLRFDVNGDMADGDVAPVIDGVARDGFVRLGRAEGPGSPLLLATSVRDGLAGYAATDVETWVGLSDFGLSLPTNRRVIFLDADDPSPANI